MQERNPRNTWRWTVAVELHTLNERSIGETGLGEVAIEDHRHCHPTPHPRESMMGDQIPINVLNTSV